MKNDDEDDAPTYVLENTNQSMTQEEYEAFVAEKDSKGDAKLEQDGNAKEQTKDDGLKPKDKITEIGANAKKRKVAKIISDEQEQSGYEPKDIGKLETKISKKPKKKTKAVKLTFGDEEES